MKPDGLLRRISDSNQETVTGSRQPADESSPAFFYLITMAAGATATAMMFTRGAGSFLLFLMVTLGALVILRRWTVGLVLLLIQAALLVGQPRIEMKQASLWDLILAAAAITLLAAASRFLMVAPELSPVADLSAATRRLMPRKLRGAGSSLVRHAGHYGVAERLTLIFRVVLAVGGAAFLLRSIPVNPFALDEAWLIPSGLRLISLGVLLLAIFLVTDLLLDVVTWRRISPREARLFLRSVLTSWCDRELRAIFRHGLKQRRSRR